MWREEIKKEAKTQSLRLPGGGGGYFPNPKGENSSACPARQACISLAVRDCHRERDSPPEGLSFGFSNTRGVGCQSKKDDTQELSRCCGRVDAAYPLSRISGIMLASYTWPNGFCGQ